MMSTKVAARVIARLSAQFPGFAARIDNDADIAELTVDEWSRGLRGIDLNKIDNALDLVRGSSSNFAPSLPKFLEYCGGKAPVARPKIEYRGGGLDYQKLWQSADDKTKFRFFVDHSFQHVPGFIRQWFVNYNAEHRGWSHKESWMMIHFHRLPYFVSGDDSSIAERKMKMRDLMSDHQSYIIDYFTNRRSA